MHTRLLLGVVAAAAVGLAATAASAATTFTGGYSETHNTADPGLVVNTQPINSSFSFSLDPGQSASIDLFKIFTNESSVNVGEDTVAKPINVTFSFTSPTSFNGSIGGTTAGESDPLVISRYFKLDGFYQNGVLTWNNGGDAVLGFGSGGQLAVHLNNVDFNNGIGGLYDGPWFGKTVTATFTEIKGAVPEPATWATMIVGLFGAGTILRRAKKEQAAFATVA